MSTKNILSLVVILLIIIGGAYYFLSGGEDSNYNKDNTPVVIDETINTDTENEIDPTDEITDNDEPVENIGQSAGGKVITAYHFGEGDTEVLFIGGIHGGYSWNTALLGYELVEWFTKNADKVPDNVRVTVIPVLNPDGLEKVTGKLGLFTASDVNKTESVRVAGRFNDNNVDLNRNFNCEWQAVGKWQNKDVSGGTAAFSEPEAQAIQSYVGANKPAAVVTWYSAAGGVYASDCKKGVSEDTLALTNLFAKASGYTAYEEFDYYEITGDMVNWLAGQGIPAISVLLTNHEQTEFSKNIAGVEAVLEFYAE